MWYRLCISIVLSVGVPASSSAQTPIATEVDQQSLSISEPNEVQNDGRADASESSRIGRDANAESVLPEGLSLEALGEGRNAWVSPEGLTGSVQTLIALTVLSMAPAILLMTTCYVRIVIVLGILKQAIGLQALPPGQVMTSIALFMTLFVMTPVWNSVYKDAIEPYTSQEVPMSLEDAYAAGVVPIRRFMSKQIDVTGNHDDVHLFYDYMGQEVQRPKGFEEVPMRVLLPAFLLSELKTAFLMGFQIFLPFLVVDLVVASVTISMGMLMLPPQVVSLPFKLLLFVLVDGWRLVVQMLMDSFGTIF